MNPTSQPYNGGPDSAHPSTANEGNPAPAGTHEAPVSQSESGDDPGEFGIGIMPNPKARYWQGRAAFWRNEAIARGYKITEEPDPPGDPGQRARALADEWRHVLTDGKDGHDLCASRNTVAQFVRAIDAITAALAAQASTEPEVCPSCLWVNPGNADAPAEVMAIALPMETAPRDGTMVRLLVQFDDHATEDTEGPAWTIGACYDDNVGEGEGFGWQFAGWCWSHDHFTEGKGVPVGWLPMLGAATPSPRSVDDAAVAAPKGEA